MGAQEKGLVTCRLREKVNLSDNLAAGERNNKTRTDRMFWQWAGALFVFYGYRYFQRKSSVIVEESGTNKELSRIFGTTHGSSGGGRWRMRTKQQRPRQVPRNTCTHLKALPQAPTSGMNGTFLIITTSTRYQYNECRAHTVNYMRFNIRREKRDDLLHAIKTSVTRAKFVRCARSGKYPSLRFFS